MLPDDDELAAADDDPAVAVEDEPTPDDADADDPEPDDPPLAPDAPPDEDVCCELPEDAAPAPPELLFCSAAPPLLVQAWRANVTSAQLTYIAVLARNMAGILANARPSVHRWASSIWPICAILARAGILLDNATGALQHGGPVLQLGPTITFLQAPAVLLLLLCPACAPPAGEEPQKSWGGFERGPSVSLQTPARAMVAVTGSTHTDVWLAEEIAHRVEHLVVTDETVTVAESTPAGVGPRVLTTADLDGDGQLDLAVASAPDHLLLVFTMAPGTLTLRSQADLGVPAHAMAAVHNPAAGRDSLALALDPVGTVRVAIWEESAAGLQQRGTALELPGASAMAWTTVMDQVAMGAVVQATEDRLALVAWDHGVLGLVEQIPVCSRPYDVSLLGNTAAVACNTGGVDVVDSTFSAPRVSHLDGGGNMYQAWLADVDMDGVTDVLGVDVAGHRALVWTQRHNASLGFATGRGPIAMALLQSAQGVPDLLVLEYEDRSVTRMNNAGR